jgi:hypothetical protein
LACGSRGESGNSVFSRKFPDFSSISDRFSLTLPTAAPSEGGIGEAKSNKISASGRPTLLKYQKKLSGLSFFNGNPVAVILMFFSYLLQITEAITFPFFVERSKPFKLFCVRKLRFFYGSY